MIDFNPANYRYTAQFCEENIWWLAQSLQEQGFNIDWMEVIFFSNSKRKVVMMQQRYVPEGQLVVWDYHVVLKLHLDGGEWIFDFDSRLPFPVIYDKYRQYSFLRKSGLPEHLHIRVRVVPAHFYLSHFYSDRSHMHGLISVDRFPDYPIIQPAAGDRRIGLSELWNMEKDLDGCELTMLDQV